MEVICSSETLVHIWTTRRYIAEDGTIHKYGCENLRSYIMYALVIYEQLRGSKSCHLLHFVKQEICMAQKYN
jgi:hypothetical protein